MIVRISMIFLFIFGASACTNTQDYEEDLSAWVGLNMVELVDAWGYPESSFQSEQGNTVYVYRRLNSYSRPNWSAAIHSPINSPAGSSVSTGGGYITNSSDVQGNRLTNHYWCQTSFEVDESNVITQWNFEGNKCQINIHQAKES